MLVNRILKVVLLLLGGSFVVLEGFAFEVEAAAVSAATLILLTVLYCKSTENKTTYFFCFLVTFTLAHVLSYVSYYLVDMREGGTDYVYYIANLLYILAYVFLIVKIIIDLELKKVFSELSIIVLRIKSVLPFMRVAPFKIRTLFAFLFIVFPCLVCCITTLRISCMRSLTSCRQPSAIIVPSMRTNELLPQRMTASCAC